MWLKSSGAFCSPVVETEGEPRFIAADVCAALGLHGYASQHTAKFHGSERKVISHAENTRHLFINTKAPKLTSISESGLYKVVMRSDKPEAKQFQR